MIALIDENFIDLAHEIQKDKEDATYVEARRLAQANLERARRRPRIAQVAAHTEAFNLEIDGIMHLFRDGQNPKEAAESLAQVNELYAPAAFDTLDAARRTMLEALNVAFTERSKRSYMLFGSKQGFRNMGEAAEWIKSQQGDAHLKDRIDFLNITSGLKAMKVAMHR